MTSVWPTFPHVASPSAHNLLHGSVLVEDIPTNRFFRFLHNASPFEFPQTHTSCRRPVPKPRGPGSSFTCKETGHTGRGDPSPPLRGCLRCAGIRKGNHTLPKMLAYGFLNGPNFLFLEFGRIYWKRGQHLLRGCKNTLRTQLMETVRSPPILRLGVSFPLHLWGAQEKWSWVAPDPDGKPPPPIRTPNDVHEPTQHFVPYPTRGVEGDAFPGFLRNSRSTWKDWARSPE